MACDSELTAHVYTESDNLFKQRRAEAAHGSAVSLDQSWRTAQVRDLAPDIVRQRLLIEGHYSVEVDSSVVESYLLGIATHLNLRTYGNPIVHAPGGIGKDENAGFDAFIPLIDSGISLYVWSKKRFFAAVLFTCKGFDVESALQFTRDYFGVSDLEHRSF